MEYLTKDDLQKMFLAASKRIEKDKEKINKINVFPVPDQDTGGNLAKTLNGVREAIEGKEFKDLSEFSEAALDGALTAAQGNAGVIYTGFLAGFLPSLNENSVNSDKKDFSDRVDAEKLAIAFEKGRERAWQSIQNPKPGTILDIIDATVQVFKEEAKKEKNIVVIFKKAVKKAKEALLATPEKMELLKKANVVDAGGLGFLMILESYLEVLTPLFFKTSISGKKPSGKSKRFVQMFSNRYEVVALIENPRFSEEEIKNKLKKLGNSIDIVQVGNRIKIHIHTDFPDNVKNIMKNIGQIQTLREQDMAKEVVGEPSIKKVSIGIVTDEIADLLPKIVEKYQIEVVPFKIDWPDGENLAGDNIYQKMREAEKAGIKTLPKTSQASPKEFLDAFKRQFEKGFEEIVCITLSSKLSGGYNSACQARDILPEEQKNKVFIIDSYQVTCGEALLVLKAIELIQEQRGVSEIIQELKNTIPNIYVYAFLKDPKWLEWGGRISHSQANWIRRLQKIGVRPLLGIKDGVVEQIGFRFGVKETPEAIFKEIETKSKKVRKNGKKIRVVITHCDNLEEAEKLKDILKNIKAEVSFINLTGSVVGVHVGPGALIAGWTEI
ncbi:MAG: DegV family protein [Candidatus Pacebacteria bacterium]|nr:DegV family protein [Candidatus Paceibacterota bacterium]